MTSEMKSHQRIETLGLTLVQVSGTREDSIDNLESGLAQYDQSCAELKDKTQTSLIKAKMNEVVTSNGTISNNIIANVQIGLCVHPNNQSEVKSYLSESLPPSEIDENQNNISGLFIENVDISFHNELSSECSIKQEFKLESNESNNPSLKIFARVMLLILALILLFELLNIY